MKANTGCLWPRRRGAATAAARKSAPARPAPLGAPGEAVRAGGGGESWGRAVRAGGEPQPPPRPPASTPAADSVGKAGGRRAQPRVASPPAAWEVSVPESRDITRNLSVPGARGRVTRRQTNPQLEPRVYFCERRNHLVWIHLVAQGSAFPEGGTWGPLGISGCGRQRGAGGAGGGRCWRLQVAIRVGPELAAPRRGGRAAQLASAPSVSGWQAGPPTSWESRCRPGSAVGG